MPTKQEIRLLRQESEEPHSQWLDGAGGVSISKVRYRMSRKKFLKKRSHRRVRRSSLSFRKGNGSNKLFDYWWELW